MHPGRKKGQKLSLVVSKDGKIDDKKGEKRWGKEGK